MAGPWEKYADGPWAKYGPSREEQVAVQQESDRKLYDPTAGMSTLEKFNAGAGKAFADLARGIGQKLRLVSNDDVAESRQLDSPLMKTGAGLAGNVGANVAMLAPTALVPGANTVTGAAAVGGLVGALQPSTSTKEAFVNTGLGAGGGAAGQWVAGRAGQAVANQEAQNALKATQDAQRVTAAQNANKAGYVIPPEDLGGGAATKLLSGLGGKIKTAQDASVRNQQVTNGLAKKAVGVASDEPLTIDALKAVRQQAGQAYDAIKNTGTVVADRQYAQALDDIAQTYNKAAQAFPGAVKNDIPDIVASLKQPQFSADAAVDMTKVLRAAADKAFAAGDKDLGKAHRAAADALEGALERHLGAINMPDALKAFRDARQTIAKTYSVEKALNTTTGDVAAGTFANALKKGSPLSGDLRTIAEAAQAFPKATQALKEAPKALSPLDWTVAGGGAMAGHPAALLALAARPAARSILLSGPAQQRMLQAAAQPAPANPLARLLSQEELTLPLGLAAGNALAQVAQ